MTVVNEDPEDEANWTPLTFLNQVLRYPVLIGGAVIATFEAADPSAAPATKVAVVAWVTLLQSALSLSKKTATEQAQGAAYIGALEHQTTTQAAQLLAQPAPPPVA